MTKKIFFIIALSISFVGCKKDPQGLSPVDQVTNGNYPKNLGDLQTFLTASYSNFRKDYFLYGFYMLPINMAGSDHAASLAGDLSLSRVEVASNHLSLYNVYAAALWEGLYIGVKNTNVCLERCDYFEARNPQFKAEIDDIRGQALFLRGWYYFHLECFFGEKYIDMTQPENTDVLGVPLFTKMPVSFEETRKPRSSAYKIWSQVIDDLESSAIYLNGIARSGDNLGKATKWSAKALLGKAYVFTKQWDKAKTTLEDVITNSGKTLMPFSKYKDAFNAKPENEFNEESLFEINVERVTEGTNGIFTPVFPSSNLTTSHGMLWSPSVLGYNGTESDQSCLTVGERCQFFVHDKNLLRFGFNKPPYTLVHNPNYIGNPTPDGSGGSAIVPELIMDPNYKNESIQLRQNKTTDPRLYVAALQPWVDSCGDAYHVQLSSGKRNEMVPVSRCYNIPQANKPKYHGWSFKKYTTIDNSLYAYNGCDGANIYLIRMADVYLLYAEALKNLGQNVPALEYINKVHRRAYDQPINSPSPYDYLSLTAQTKASDVNLENNPLAYERWAELFAEGHWWFDVCRWRIGDKEAAYYGIATPESPNPNSPNKGKIEWDDNRSYCYPIPGNEFDVNPQIQKQRNNSGY
ncbi:RagB/SusD family nutrient uptake outer membrane protein [Ferruginibacter lapsinanis]|uniref:RagB/SusD family nutrient uptake outer membrane protein n=1 Tax=Ferruginibacter lapsinanis TaxID=563172 RepID=UPI001E4B0392|nr:RagB/SusD family nutrient uptake outer membrane protein [Ferruginibacter lapsinanis]UEG49082.1 RagB/SusD family nutrient uptake outer membrane protein [Ferruginibacter lapsinanis]